MINLGPLLRPLVLRDDRVSRLEAQVSFLAERVGIPPQELELHRDPPMPDEARRLLAEGHRIPAIKEYRKATGASLSAAVRIVDARGIPPARRVG
ncbi:MAG: hypothetical protein ACR2IP_07420 [Solirubrobacteraceae bacterium]